MVNAGSYPEESPLGGGKSLGGGGGRGWGGEGEDKVIIASGL